MIGFTKKFFRESRLKSQVREIEEKIRVTSITREKGGLLIRECKIKNDTRHSYLELLVLVSNNLAKGIEFNFLVKWIQNLK